MSLLESFVALRSDAITLHLINESNADGVRGMLRGFPDSDYMLHELEQSYLPQYDSDGRRRKYGFYATLHDELAGLQLLGVSSWGDARGYTGADVLTHMRGRGVTPSCKPHLFYLGFALLGLNRIETGCFVSNVSSRRSLEKTLSLQFEGVLRDYARNERGEFEDELRYAILRRDWLQLYDPHAIDVLT